MASRTPERRPAIRGQRPEFSAEDWEELDGGGVPRVEGEEMHAILADGYDRETGRPAEGRTRKQDVVDGYGAGQHFAIFSPTEGGKSHLIRYGLLPLWKRYPVLWIRFKQRDDSTRKFGTKVDRYPIVERVKYRLRRRDSDRWEDDPEWYLLQLGTYRFDASAPQDKSAAWQHARRVCGEAMDRAFREGGWVLVIDELQAVNGRRPPGLDLEAALENCFQRGRTQPVTMITASQQPAWNNPSAYDQARWVALGRSLDEARWERIGQLGGSRERIEAAIPTLKGARQPGGPEFLIVDRWTGEMWIATAPPK